MNFFDPACQEPPFTHTLFGICDDEDGNKAYTDVTNPDKWIATVENNGARQLTT